MAATNARDLTRAEQSFVTQVMTHLQHEPERRQRTMEYLMRGALKTAKPCDTYARMERDWGTPESYANSLREQLAERESAESAIEAPKSRKTLPFAIAAIVVVAIIIVAIVLATG